MLLIAQREKEVKENNGTLFTANTLHQHLTKMGATDANLVNFNEHWINPLTSKKQLELVKKGPKGVLRLNHSVIRDV